MAMDAGAEVLDHGGSGPSGGSHAAPRSRRRWVLPAVGASVLMLGVAGAGVALGMMVSGGGTQPEELVPADAILYADVDFDPAAGQKANLLQLLNKFPDVADDIGGRDDIRALVIEGLTEGTDADSDEILSWLGDRAGFAVVPGDGDTSVAAMGVLQVTDEEAARATLEKDLEPEQIAFESGYVVITSESLDFGAGVMAEPLQALPAQDVIDDALAASLADDPDFQGIFDPLGDGLASFYVDFESAGDLLQAFEEVTGVPGAFGDQGSVASLSTGQAGAILRVDPDAIEVVGRSTEPLPGGPPGSSQLFTQLPADTAVAFDVVGAGEQVDEQWQQLLDQLSALGEFSDPLGSGVDQIALTSQVTQPDPQDQFERQVAKFEARYNVRLPEDIATALGDEFVVSLSSSGLTDGVPGVGMRSLTDPAEAADLVNRVESLINDVTGGFGITLLPVDDGLVVASTPEYAETLAAGEGGILDNPAVTKALPDLDNAAAVVFVDFDVIGDLAGLSAPDADENIDPLEALGVSVTSDEDGQSLRVRLTFDE